MWHALGLDSIGRVLSGSQISFKRVSKRAVAFIAYESQVDARSCVVCFFVL